MSDRSIRVRFIADVQPLRVAMAQAGSATREFGRELAGHGRATDQHLQRVGRSALVMAGLIGAGLGLSAKAAMDWESAWAGVTKTVDGSASEMAELEDGLRNLARELPATHGEIAAVAEAAGALGIQRSAIEGFTKVMIDLGETTDLTADQAASSMARIANIMGTAHSEFDRLGSVLVDLGNNGASTESEILELSQRLAAAGRIAGLSEADVFAFASTLASVGVEAEAGGTALSKVFTTISDAVLDGGDKLETFARVAGVSADRFAASFQADPAKAIESFISGLGRMIAAGQSTTTVFDDLELSDQRLLRAIRSTATAGSLLADQIDMASAAWDENNALQLEAEKRYDTTAAKLEMARNSVVDLGIDVGAVLLPALIGAADAAGTVARGFGELEGAGGTAVEVLAGVTFATTGVIGALGYIGPKVRAFQDSLRSMGAAGVANNLGKISLALGAVGAAVGIYTYILGQNAQRKQDAIDLSKEYAEAIRSETGALVQNIDAITAQKLGEFSGTARLRELGADFDVLLQGVRETGDALKGVSDSFVHTEATFSRTKDLAGFLEDAGLAGTALGDELLRLRDSMTAKEFDDFLSLLGELGIGYADGAVLAANLEGANRGVGASSDAAAPKVGALGEQVTTTKEAMEEVEEAGRRFKEGVEAALSPLDQRAALDQFNDDLLSIGERFNDAAADVEDAADRKRDAEADLADLLATPADERGDDFARQVEDARDRIADAQADIDEAIAATSRELEGNGRAALENRDAIDQMTRDATRAIEQAAADQGNSITDLEALRASLIEQMEAELTQLGFNEEQVHFYTDALREIPLGELATSVRLDVDAALVNAEKLLAKFDRLVGLGLGFSVDALEVEKAMIRNASKPKGSYLGGPVGHAMGAPGAGDRIPALLAPGEYVLNEDASSALGAETLASLNRGVLPYAAVASQGGAAGGQSIDVSGGITLNYPKPEEPSQVVPRALRKVALMVGN